MSVDPTLTGEAVVLVSVSDVNDNPPTLATDYHTFVCEKSEPGQVTFQSFGGSRARARVREQWVWLWVTSELQPDQLTVTYLLCWFWS